MVNFDGPAALIGRFVDVRITEALPNSLRGELVATPERQSASCLKSCTATAIDHPSTLDLALEPEDNERLANLCGPLEGHLRLIERRLGIEINNRGNRFHLVGMPEAVRQGSEVLKSLYAASATEVLDMHTVHLFLQESGVEALLDRLHRAATCPKW